jgi:hypothetical protein
MTIAVKDANGDPQTVSTLDDLIALVGSVTASPTTNTLLARLKALQDNTDGLEALIGTTNTSLASIVTQTDTLEALITTLNGYADGLEGLIGTTNSTLSTLATQTDTLETLIAATNGYVDGLETKADTTNTKLDTLIAGVGSPGPQTAADSTSVIDAGSGITSSWGVSGVPFTSANASAADAAVTDAPTTGQKIVIDDILISVDTSMTVTFKEETSGTVLFGPWYMSSNSGPVQVTLRGKKKLATVNKKVMIRTSAAGNITASLSYHSEA